MNKVMTYENLRNFAYSNDKLLTGAPRGIVVNFFGLGGMSIFDEDTSEGKYYAEQGIIYLVPYNNPWAWMNKQAVAYTDEVIEVIMKEYSLPDTLPIVANGGSMGGMSALVYTRYARRTPVCCVANCPVCDLPFHFTERADLPRTLYSAFWHEEGDVSEALKSASPLHLIPEMPKIDYHVFHCDCDMDVNIHNHSEVFVEAMREAGHSISYTVVEGRPHCDLPAEVWEAFHKICADACRGSDK